MRVAVALALALCACTDTADMFPINNQAQKLGVPRVEFRRGLPQGPVHVVMPDGEELNGSFRVAVGGGVVTAFGSGGTATGLATSGGGNFFAAARGPKTTLTCVGNVSFGHGGGICRTQDGAEYQVQM